ncbi:MAG: DUF1749 domain-containing protein [Gammaproteobacteria bacterium]|nr:DUF1749 domain-containing protein [Gammaproteobacteria bacterium]
MLKTFRKFNRGRRPLLWFVALAFCIPLQAQSKEVTLKYNGLTLNANLEMVEGKGFEDGIVLILHGMMAHNRMEIIETSQQALLENDHSSLAITLSLGIDNRRGFVDCLLPQTHTIEDSMGEIDAWVQWLVKKGAGNIVLMAHSRGANQMMVYAVEYDHPAASHVVLLAPNTTENGRKNYEGRYDVETFDENLARATMLVEAGDGDTIMKQIDFSFCPKSNVSAATFHSYNHYDDRFRRFQLYLPKMPKPTLIIVGTEDELQPNLPQKVGPYVDGVHVQLSKIESAGHFFRDFNIDEAVENAVSFINETE